MDDISLTATPLIASLPDGTNLYAENSESSINAANRYLLGIGNFSTDTLSCSNAPDTWLAISPGVSPPATKFAYNNVRGFKYGVMHSEPRSPITHFRHDTYGQFRDMLEQSLDGRLVTKRTGYAVTLGSSPVTIRFVGNDRFPIRGLETASSNLSTMATSSLPYFDGESRNRGPIDTAQLGLTIVST